MSLAARVAVVGARFIVGDATCFVALRLQRGRVQASTVTFMQHALRAMKLLNMSGTQLRAAPACLKAGAACKNRRCVSSHAEASTSAAPAKPLRRLAKLAAKAPAEADSELATAAPAPASRSKGTSAASTSAADAETSPEHAKKVRCAATQCF